MAACPIDILGTGLHCRQWQFRTFSAPPSALWAALGSLSNASCVSAQLNVTLVDESTTAALMLLNQTAMVSFLDGASIGLDMLTFCLVDAASPYCNFT